MILDQVRVAEEIYNGGSDKLRTDIEDDMIRKIMVADEVLFGDDRVITLKAIGTYVNKHGLIIGPDQKTLIESIR